MCYTQAQQNRQKTEIDIKRSSRANSAHHLVFFRGIKVYTFEGLDSSDKHNLMQMEGRK